MWEFLLNFLVYSWFLRVFQGFSLKQVLQLNNPLRTPERTFLSTSIMFLFFYYYLFEINKNLVKISTKKRKKSEIKIFKFLFKNVFFFLQFIFLIIFLLFSNLSLNFQFISWFCDGMTFEHFFSFLFEFLNLLYIFFLDIFFPLNFLIVNWFFLLNFYQKCSFLWNFKFR